MKRLVLTDRAVQAARPRKDGKARYLPDAFVPGLKVCVMPTGTKSWIAQPRLFGRQIKLTFGSFPNISLVVARELARAALCDIAVPRVAKARHEAALARPSPKNFFAVMSPGSKAPRRSRRSFATN
jgi:hypothetical protein